MEVVLVMKKWVSCLVLSVACLSVGFSIPAFAEADFHIGVMTATVSQAEDDLRGAQALIEKYGDVADGGMVTHITYPDNFTTEVETTISQLVGLADDPKMKAIVTVQGPEGTTEAFRRIREKRPDILLLSTCPLEDPTIVAKVADVCADIDRFNFGYIIAAAVKKMGADTFVHVSFPRHMSMEVISRRFAIMKRACDDFGMKFVSETAPDPTTDVGVAGTQQYLLEKVPAWLEQYGKNTAFFSTNAAHHEPIIKRLIDNKAGFYSFGDMPSTIKGYPGAMNLDLSQEKGDWEAILKKVEQVAVDAGMAGRLGTWKYSFAYTQALGMGEHAKRVLEGKSKITSMQDVRDAYEEQTPGSKWNFSQYEDAGTGAKLRNSFLMFQAPYVLGSGFLDISDVKIPDDIMKIK
jgi:hypothetical protein